MKDVKQPSATLAAVDKIRQLIFSGELAADSNHLEAELAGLLGISRTPVREATLILHAQGLLEVRPRKGIKIKSISVTDMADIYEVLTELECLAARRAATAGYSSKNLSALRNTIRDMDSALNNKDLEAWLRADEAFHSELLRLGGNKHAESIVLNVTDQVRRARSITLNMRPIPNQSNKSHRKLLQAILKGEPQLASDIHRKHTKEAGQLLINILEKSGLKRL